MAIKYPSDEWLKELEAKLNASETYAQVAATWEGDIIFVVLPDDSYPGTLYGYMDLQHGKASGARELKSLDDQKAKFTMTAPFSTWRKTIEGRMDPLQAMFSGKIKVVGSMAQIQRTPKATYELTKIAGLIDSDFQW